ncbi:MAG: hypothetical protein WBF71_09705 [Microthrixaceae bacterium]
MVDGMEQGRADDLIEMDDEQWLEMLDDAARRNLGMSGSEFLAKYEAREFGDFDDDGDVMRVAALVPFDRRARA